ncbi:MAG TPA: SOS response-associated peptidase [Aerococcus urinaeequi]|nr:SOS response-associated peptidase [Aerococcus urinaeequi]
MCGRYLYDKNDQILFDYYEEIKSRGVDVSDLRDGTIYPSNQVVTLGANPDGEIVSGITRWGFTGFKPSQLMINARIETIREKKTFKGPFEGQRIVFPMSAFFEFSEDKEAFTFSDSGRVIYVGGFYRIYPDKKTGQKQAESIIITTEPDEVVSPIHNRMPLLIPQADIAKWILDDDFAFNYQKPAHQQLVPTKVS